MTCSFLSFALTISKQEEKKKAIEFWSSDSVRPHMFKLFSIALIRRYSGVIVASLALIAPAQAQSSVSGMGPQDIYQDCITLAASDPDQAYDMAQSWSTQGGGPPAQHCAALSLVNLGHYGAAAEQLEELAGMSGLGEPELRAEVLTQAGNSWLMADAPARGVQTLSQALSITGENAAILTDRARAYGMLEDWEKARDDLDNALSLNPEYTPAYIYRASARRKLDQLDMALEDIELAIALDSTMPEAFLERGLIHLERDNGDAARKDWLSTIALAPEHAYAETARKYLEALDVKAE